jgi:hypothetical protein
MSSISFIPKNSKIHTKNGLVNIEEIIKNDEIMTIDGYKKVNKIMSAGIKPIYTIITSKGKLNCSCEHNIPVINNNQYVLIPANKLKINNKLILTQERIPGTSNIILPSIDFKSRIDRLNVPIFTEEVSWFFGFLILGGVNLKQSFKIFCNDYKQLKKICKIIKMFGTNISIITTTDTNNNIIEITSYNFIDYIMKYLKSNTIPYFINETTYENRLAYICGIIDGIKSNHNNSIKILIENETFIKDLNNLLYSCGLECNTNKNTLTILETSSLNIIKKNIFLDSKITIDLSTISNNIYINNYLCSSADFVEIKHNIDIESYKLEFEETTEFFCDGYLISS